MLTYFEATMLNGHYSKSVIFEVITIVDGKRVVYNHEISQDMLSCKGYLDHMFDGFKRKVRDLIEKEKEE